MTSAALAPAEAIRLGMIAAFVFAALTVAADSPLSSADLSSAYLDVPAVASARASVSRLTAEASVWPVVDAEAFLLGDGPIDQKIAVLDAFGWGHTDVPQRFIAALAKRKGIPLDDLAKKNLSVDEKAVFGYALALADIWTLKAYGIGNDLRTTSPVKLLDEARRARPKDFTIAFAHMLASTNGMMQGNWCRIWKAAKAVAAKFPDDQRNLRPAAVESAMTYLMLYRESCADERLPPEEHPDADSVNAMALFGADPATQHILVATQGGAFVVDARTLEKQRFLPEEMCFHAVGFADLGFVTCSKGAYVVEGAGPFKKIWTMERSIEGGLDLFVDKDGVPLLKEAKLWRRFDGATFAKTTSPFASSTRKFDPYDVVARRDGSVWGVDFLRSLVIMTPKGETQVLPRNVDAPGAYPGTDPRSFAIDGVGRVWVCDFERGFFVYDDDAGAFSRVDVVENQASVVLFDASRERTIFVPYRATPIVVLGKDARSGARHALEAPGIDYLHDAVLVDDGSVVIGGTPGLVRYRVGSDAAERRSLRRAPGTSPAAAP